MAGSELDEGLTGDWRTRLHSLGRELVAPNTRRAIDGDLRYILAWAGLSGFPAELPMSVDVTARFLIEHLFDGLPRSTDEGLIALGIKKPGRHAISTIRRRFACLSAAHSERGLPNPCWDPQVRLLHGRAYRQALADGWSPTRSDAIHSDVLERILATCGDDLIGLRDRALILFAVFSGGRRNSEISGATVDRLVRVGDDYEYLLGPTKGLRSSETGVIPLTGRVARAVDAWLVASGITDGPIFRALSNPAKCATVALHPHSILLIVRNRVAKAGLDPKAFSARSLRSGFMTYAVNHGVPMTEAMGISFHRSLNGASVYHRAGKGLTNQAARIGG